MITDAPESRLKNPSIAAATSASKIHYAPSPSTSVGTPTGHNHFSPNWSPLSVQEDGLSKQQQKFLPAKSRVETILEKAKQQNNCNNKSASNSCDVIESALKLGITVWLLPKIIIWVESFKGRIGPLENLRDRKKRSRPSASSPLDQQVDERPLKTPFIKYDDVQHECRPVLCEFHRFPKIYCGGRAGQSPFFSPDLVKHHKVREFPDNKKRQLPVENNPPNKQGSKQKAKRAAQAQGGYCELCEAPFSELEEHISSKVHIARVGLSHLWTKLDSCIDQVNKGTSEGEEDFESDVIGVEAACDH